MSKYQHSKYFTKITVAVSLSITILFSLLAARPPAIIDEHLETLLADYRLKIDHFIAPRAVPSDVLIVTVDEKSLERHGRWPWSRKLQAELISRICKGGPKVVAVDIMYPETESPEADLALAEVVKANKDRLVIALGFEVEEGREFKGDIDEALYDHAIPKIENADRLRPVKSFRAMLPPRPITGQAVFGHVYSLPDRDGKTRWEPLYIEYGDEYFPSLSLQAARITDGISIDQVSIAGGTGVYLDNVFIPSDNFGRFFIRYYGKEGSFSMISAADVLSDTLPEGLFKDKMVFVGTSAVATYDLKVTPFSAGMPGVEKNAAVLANIKSRNFLIRSPLYLDVLAVLLAGAAAFIAARRRKAIISIIYFFAFTCFIVLANQITFTFYNMWINLVFPLLTILMISAILISYRYFVEEKKAGEIRAMFSNYVTERVVNELIKRPEMAKLGGERREITILFSDIVGFTPFSEEHEPEEVVAVLNEYLAAMTDVIFRWEGTLDKFIGDEIVAFWGAPMEQENHAERAVRCALDMIKRLEELRLKRLSEGKTPLSMGIGINTGEVLVGNIGSERKKMDYTVIGDHVNIGSRVEALTRKFNAGILVTELSYNKISHLIQSGAFGHIVFNDAGNVVVKGKQEPLKIYEVKSMDA